MIPIAVCEIRETEVNRTGLPVYPESFRRLLSQLSMWDPRYVAFSLKVNGSENPSALERILSGMGKVECDALATGEASQNCDFRSFVEGKAAIVVYDTKKLKEVGEGRFKRPDTVSPLEYIAVVVMPKVKEAAVA